MRGGVRNPLRDKSGRAVLHGGNRRDGTRMPAIVGLLCAVLALSAGLLSAGGLRANAQEILYPGSVATADITPAGQQPGTDTPAAGAAREQGSMDGSADPLAALTPEQRAQYEQLVQKVMEDYRQLAYANWDSISLPQKILATQTASKTDEILLVIDHNVTQWQRQPDGTWAKILDTYCGYGRNGLTADKREGDRKTPIGSFPILHAFGTQPNPGTQMTYLPVTPYSYWSGERSTYNTWVESTVPIAGEHLADYYQYAYALAIGYNRDPVEWGRGSAIFFHCKSTDHWYTAGCISVRQEDMIRILQQSHDGEYIIIVPDEAALKSY